MKNKISDRLLTVAMIISFAIAGIQVFRFIDLKFINSKATLPTTAPIITAVPSLSPEITAVPSGEPISIGDETEYIGNRNSKKFHRQSCGSLPKEKNRVYIAGRDNAVEMGYSPCANCDP